MIVNGFRSVIGVKPTNHRLGAFTVFDDLDKVPWGELEHAYGAAEDVPDILRQLLSSDPKIRADAIEQLYGNIFHQGTRYPATPFVVPFLIELCSDPTVPDRFQILSLWGSLITGYFSLQERPTWGDGERIYFGGEVQESDDDPYTAALHGIYRESLKGHDLLCELLEDEDPRVRMGATWVLACLPTMAASSVERLAGQNDPVGWVRAATAFALGELDAPAPLRRMLFDDIDAVRCMAACELARLEPAEALIEPLLEFVSTPIDGYEAISGSGGKSSGDAAFAISLLPPETRKKAIPAICDRLAASRSFDTMPLVGALLAAAFPPRKEPLAEPTELQRYVLSRMIDTEEFWSIGNLSWTFETYGLPKDRSQCAELIGARVADDPALEALRGGLAFSEMGFLEEARRRIRKALELDPTAVERSPAPEEASFLYAKAFAETEPKKAFAAYRRAIHINPSIAHKIDPRWRLAELVEEREGEQADN